MKERDDEIKNFKVMTFDEDGNILYVSKEDNFITRAVARLSAEGFGMERSKEVFMAFRKKTNGK